MVGDTNNCVVDNYNTCSHFPTCVKCSAVGVADIAKRFVAIVAWVVVHYIRAVQIDSKSYCK